VVNFLRAGNPKITKSYLEKVMPHKLEMYEQYVKDQNLWLDIRIILATLLKMVNLNHHNRLVKMSRE